VTNTFLFLADVLQQSEATLPPGYPHTWTSVTADYDMDPDIVNSTEYGPEIEDDMKSIPTLSVVTDIDHLFGTVNGIYTHTERRGPESERPISMEVIYPDGSPGIQVNAGIRLQGEFSRAAIVKKHSFRMVFKSQYGPSTLDFPLMPDNDVQQYDALVLTGGHGDAWHGGDVGATYMRDTWAKDTLTDMGQLSSHSLYMHLYLNGIYWGMYRVTERPDGGFLAAHLGGDKEDYDAINSHEPVDGDRVAWETLQTLANAGLQSQANYDAVAAICDLSDLIDYFLVNLYGNNNDWDSKNWYAGRKREPGAQFKFFSWDYEDTLRGVTGSRITVDSFDSPSSIWSDLWTENAEFRVLVGDHVQRHMFNDGALTPHKVAERWMRRANEIHGAMAAESARWGDMRRSIPYQRDKEWLVEQQRLLLSYFPRRNAEFLDALRSRGLYPNVAAPVFSQLGGEFSPGFQLTLSAPAGTIYYTLDGSDPRITGGGISASAIPYSSPIALAASGHVAARALVGTDWSALEEADFVLERPLRVTELMYNPTGTNLEYVELANVGDDPFDVGGMAFTVGITFTFPSMVVPAGGRVLVVQNLAAFQAFYGMGLPIAGVYTGALSNGGEQLLLVGPDMGTVQNFTYSDAWYPTTDGGGYSLVIRDPYGDPALWNVAAGWRASTALQGSPGNPEPAACADGFDNDNDGAIDLADDGCANAAQNIENPECDDGLDNDDDGDVDIADTNCDAASDAIEGPPPVDPFLCYRTSANRDGTELVPTDVTLDDELDAAGTYTLRRSSALCAATSLNDASIIDPAVHLIAYDILSTSTATLISPVRVETVLGPLYVDKARPDRLLVPSAMDLDNPVSAPAPGSHVVDHYKCYQVKQSKLTPNYFPSNAQGAIANAFDDRNVRLNKPKHLCAPVDVDGQGVLNPDGYLFCYPTKPAKFSTRHVPVAGIYTANAFASETLSTSKDSELCVPAHVELP
jgi:hypothetical protein